jgi:hypothetical protein
MIERAPFATCPKRGHLRFSADMVGRARSAIGPKMNGRNRILGESSQNLTDQMAFLGSHAGFATSRAIKIQGRKRG